MMNKVVKLLTVSILSSALFGGTSAWGASISADSLRGANGQVLTSLSTQAGITGLGSENGAGLSASFRIPSGLAVLPDGAVLISDTRNHEIRKWTGGQVSVYAGAFFEMNDKGFPKGSLLDGKSDLSLFQEPQGIAVDGKGNVYVADSGNHAIRKIDASGQVTTIAGNGVLGKSDGKGKEAAFYHPMDVAVAADGTLYVADTLNHLIRSISPAGEVKTLNAVSTRVVEVTPGQVVPAGDFADGDLNNAKFNEPSAIALDAKGNLYVSDSGNQRIRYVDLEKGLVTTVAGAGTSAGKSDLYAPGGYEDGEALKAQFNFPMGIALSSEGGLLIADSQNHSVRYLLDGKVITLAGMKNQTTGYMDGIEGNAGLNRPTDVAPLPDGSIMVADSYNNKLRKISLYQLPSNLPQDNNIKVVVDQKWIEFDAAPEIVNDRTMVPVRAITEALGYTVTFNDENRAVQLSKNGVTVELYIDRTGVKRMEQGKEAVVKATDVEPYIKQDRTYVPIRFFAEEIGLDVQWNDAARTAILRSKLAVNQ